MKYLFLYVVAPRRMTQHFAVVVDNRSWQYERNSRAHFMTRSRSSGIRSKDSHWRPVRPVPC